MSETTSRHQEATPRRRPVLIEVGSADQPRPPLRECIHRIDAALLIARDGRNDDAEDTQAWRLPDRLVSGLHARLRWTPRGIELSDLKSTNGTFVNGRRLWSPTLLADGDLIFVGAHAAAFRLVSEQHLAAIEEDLEQPFGPVATTSPSLALVCSKLRRLASSETEVLLTGETGVGKEVFAQAIHRASGRQGPFLAINCAALPRDLVESELFGYVRGAHSQASKTKRGLLQEAAGGTLFLDEIGEMPADAQAKLLRFLQTRSYTPLGATTPTTLDVRILAATNRGAVAGDGFGLRPDLAARLGAQPLALPALRDRIEDLGRLTAHLMAGHAGVAFEVGAFRALCLHRWPGNVRELEKTLGEAVLLARGTERITPDHLPDSLTPKADEKGELAPPQRRRRTAPDREVLEQLLVTHNGNVAEVARALNRQWAVIWRCITRHGIEIDRFRKA